MHQHIAVMLLVALLATLVPASVFAEEVPQEGEQTQEETTATSSDEQIVEEEENTQNSQATSTNETATSTDEAAQDGETASSTDDGTDGGDGEIDDGEDGTDGAGDTDTGGTATTTATTTATSTPSEGTSGSDGGAEGDGPDGTQGAEGSAGATPDDEVNPVEIISEGLLGDNDAPEDEENTGDVQTSGLNREIVTGMATAQGELKTDANSNDIRSELEDVNQFDYDTYTFTATGTNDATVSNDGLARSNSGDNYLQGRGTGGIYTGDAVAAFNIANVINTNVINSDGFIYLANKILDEGQSLDLTDSFFPDAAELEALSDTCSLLSCTAEDVVYNVSQMNHATITNNALIEAETGFNETFGDSRLLSSEIITGDAYAAANVLNVVNSNIIDSNYRLLTYNAIGDLNGDLVLPTGAMFDEFFARPNGINQAESAEDVHINVNNVNDAIVDNNVSTYAETGENDVVTDFDATTKTGRAESESNTLNKINENTYGGDSLYLLIRIHGWWDGEVVGLPEGLTWDWTPEGVIIYNIDAEIEPSELLGYDQDSYTANFDNNNRVVLQNDITLKAISGENRIDGLTGYLETGDSFASANVMNIANTNVIGTNWTMAIINILGDFEGNISFAKTDVTLTGTVAAFDPLGPGGELTYSYTVSNHSNSTATNLVLEQVLENAHTSGGATSQSVNIGTLAPGASTQVTLTGFVDEDIPYGTTTVNAFASVSGDQGDTNNADNLLQLSKIAEHVDPNASGQDNGTTTEPGPDDNTGTTTDPDGTATTTDPTGEGDDNTPPAYSQANYYSQGSYGGGGPSSSGKKKDKVEREEVEEAIDPNTPPLLTIKKEAVGIDKDDVVTAGDSVDYMITVTNKGGNAYDAEVFDVLKNPIGSIMNEQSWDLGTILPGEEIELTYTTEYKVNTPSGTYTNTASVVAYAKDGMKEVKEDPLKVKDAVNKIEISGVDLAIGNVEVLAYFPGAGGKTSALVSWETSKPSLSQVFYGLAQNPSQFNAKAPNFGYQNASFKFPTEKTKHLMIITGLENGRTHAYRIHAQASKYLATTREYLFTLPIAVPTLTLAFPTNPVSQVAGASATIPKPNPQPTAAATYTPPPAPKPVVATPPPPAPEPAPEPKQEGGVVGFVKNVFGGFFGR